MMSGKGVLEVMKEGSKSWVIWFSCIDRPRSLKRIMEAWDYQAYAGALYREGVVNPMRSNKIIEIDHIGKENTFKSNFKWFTKGVWNKIAKGIIPAQNDAIRIIADNFEDFQEFLRKHGKEFLKLESVKIFYRNRSKLVRRHPIDIFLGVMFVFYYYDTIYTLPKKQRVLVEAKLEHVQRALGVKFDQFRYAKSIDSEIVSKMKKKNQIPKFITKFNKEWTSFLK